MGEYSLGGGRENCLEARVRNIMPAGELGAGSAVRLCDEFQLQLRLRGRHGNQHGESHDRGGGKANRSRIYTGRISCVGREFRVQLCLGDQYGHQHRDCHRHRWKLSSGISH